MDSLQRCEPVDPALSAAAPVDPIEKAPLALPSRVHQALNILLEAYQYAQDLKFDPWDFAVELPTLRPFGLTNSDCRWLIGRGWIECGFELTLAGDERRSFRRSANLKLSRRTCLVLTDAGVVAVGGQVRDDSRFERDMGAIVTSAWPEHRPVSFPALMAAETKPLWDRDRQQLRVGKVIVKQFKVPAANQESVLAAFQEEGWPPRIDDPLSPQPDQDPKRRLHDTINSLNRSQKHPLIRFLGDGSGQGVRWEFISNGHAPTPPR